MPGVSSEERRMLSLDSYMAASFFHNGEILPTFDQTTGFESASLGFEISSPTFAREDVNFGNERRFVTRSLSFGANPSFHGDEWLEKDESLMSCTSLPATAVGSLVQNDGICALQKFLPSNNEDEGPIPGADAYACDDFRMYEFKVRRCMRGRSHDWTECPFAHPGEKARRRDPRRFHYSGTACPEFRKGSCRRGDACEFAHGVFECWLHPGRYRTQPCKDGRNCRRRVCFFAHTSEQLRLVPGPASPRAGKSNIPAASYDGSPLRQAMSAASAIFEGGVGSNLYDGASSPRGAVFKSNLSQVQMSSPTSTLVGHSRSPPSMSPPLSPAGSPPSHFSAWNGKNPTLAQTSPNYAEVTGVSASVLAAFARRQPSITIPLNDGLDYAAVSCPSSPFSTSKAMVDLVGSMQHLDLNNNGGVVHNNGSVWMAPYANQISAGSLHGCSPRSSNLRHCSYSLPCTPTKSALNDWEFVSDEPVQRVESGRDLRAKIYERLSRENIENNSENSPDLGWVNELVK